MVVWSLPLPAGSEGPSLIPHAARLLSVGHPGFLPAPSWRTAIRELGRREWHKRSGYSKRAMAENAVYRYKTIIGPGMRSRTLEGQRVEVQLACRILNTMTRLGMPDSYRVP